jgi:hypothetical protein
MQTTCRALPSLICTAKCPCQQSQQKACPQLLLAHCAAGCALMHTVHVITPPVCVTAAVDVLAAAALSPTASPAALKTRSCPLSPRSPVKAGDRAAAWHKDPAWSKKRLRAVLVSGCRQACRQRHDLFKLSAPRAHHETHQSTRRACIHGVLPHNIGESHNPWSPLTHEALLVPHVGH